jgi:hypothetical protein
MSKSLYHTILEMQQPLSQGEKEFKALHDPIDHKNIVPGVTDQEHVFNGDTSPVENNFPNSHKPGEDITASSPNMTVSKDVKNNGYGTKINLKKEEVEAVEEGKDMGKPGKNFAKIAKSAAKRYGSMEAGKKVAGAVLKKILAKEATVDQAKDMQEPGSEDKMKDTIPGQKSLKKLDHHAGTLRQRATRIRPVHTGMSEHITASTPTKKVIHDFVHSTNDKFDGKSTKERIRMALGASYAMKKEEVELDEAKRGRPSKNASAEGEEGGREHIIVQLRKAENLRGDKHVEFNDASKHKLPLQHVKTALNMHTGMKPIPKGEFEKRLAASHSSFMSAIKGEPAPAPKSKVSLGSMKKESKEMTSANVKKELKHDCAHHVFHKEHGEGHCIPEMHTIIEISEGVGFVTHYDVMFAHGIERDVPIQELQVLESMMHGHAPKKKMKEDMDKKSLAALAEPKDKVTKKDVLVGRGVLSKDGKLLKKEGWSKFSSKQVVEAEEMTPANVSKDASTQKVKQTKGDANMQKDSLAKIMQDKMACEEILNKLYNSLTEANQEKFNAMLEEENGIEFLLQFAIDKGIE